MEELRVMSVFKRKGREKIKRLSDVIEESLKSDLERAKENYEMALQNYNYASTEEQIDMAIVELNATRDKLNNVICALKVNRNMPVKTLAPVVDSNEELQSDEDFEILYILEE